MGSERVEVYLGANNIVSSLGVTTEDNFSAIESYTSVISKFSDGTPVAMIDRSALDLDSLAEYSFAEQLAILSLRGVIESSGVGLDSDRTQLIISTTKGNIEALNSDMESCYLSTFGDRIADYFGSANRAIVYSNACVSGVAATIIGARMIERGECDNVFVLGVDVVSEFIVAGFNSFKSISPNVCRPYDASRDGLTLGEACGAVLLTCSVELSPSRIVIAGGGISDDANHISGPSRTGDGLYNAIDVAISQAGIEVSDIGFINAHGTATLFNDEMESKAFELHSMRSIPCNSLKPYLGHTLGASGVIEIILSAEQLSRNLVFGVKGYEECGVPYELNVSSQHRDMDLSRCLKTASGFGGTNAAIVLSKIETNMVRDVRDVKIGEAASVKMSSGDVDEPFDSYIRGAYKALESSNMKFFKMDNLSKLGYVASCRLMSGVELNVAAERVGVVIANRSSSMDVDIKHQAIVDQRLAEGVSPAVFVYTLANIVAAEIAIKHKFKGELSLFIESEKSLDFVDRYARDLIRYDLCDAVLYGWCDLIAEEYNVELKLIKIE